jgi:hypothetical protein
MSCIFLVLAHWNSSPRGHDTPLWHIILIDMTLHSDTLSWLTWHSTLTHYLDWHDTPLWHIILINMTLHSDTLSWLTWHSTLTHHPDWHDTPLWHIILINMTLHSDTLSWLKSNQSLLLLLYAGCLKRRSSKYWSWIRPTNVSEWRDMSACGLLSL